MDRVPVAPFDVVDALRAERGTFVDLLRGLTGDDWHRPTECPAYDVQGVATHVLGDDLSLLSRQRDGAPSGLIAMLEPGDDLRAVLDRFNDRWVAAAQFFSPRLLIELLDVTGVWTADWYAAVDPDALGEPVGFFAATGPSPYWQIAAREYVERWVHHQQIRRALDADPLDAGDLVAMAAGVILCGVAAHLADLGGDDGAQVGVTIDAIGTWTFERVPGGGWSIGESHGTDAPAASLRLARSSAVPVLSRGLTPDEIMALLAVDGDRALATRVAEAMARLTGR